MPGRLASRKILLSLDGGIGIFDTGSEGQFPNAEFRVDEARLFVDAEVFRDVYFFTEINLTTREEAEDYVEIGELYLDFEA